MAERNKHLGATVRGLDPRKRHWGGSARACGRQPNPGHADAAAPPEPGRRGGGRPPQRSARRAGAMPEAPRVAVSLDKA
eukprot:5103817-Prymnesium_polylepis.1